MQTSYPVRKGFEKPLLIYGMQMDHFYLLLGIGVGLVVLVLLILYRCCTGSTSILVALIEIGLLAAAFFAALRSARKAATPKRYRFKKVQSFLSNRDLLNYLKRCPIN